MPSKTISVTNGDGSTRTITIPDRSRFAGVKTFSRNGKLDDSTTSIQVTVSGHSDLDGVYTGSGADVMWTQQGGNGRIATYGYSSENGDQMWFIYDDNDYDPNGFSGGLFSWSPTHVSQFPWLGLPSSHNVTITPAPETLTVNRSSDRKGESRPLLSKVVGGAAAAYSLRDLNDKAGNNKVVEVRRSSGGSRQFLAKEVSNGTLQNWVNVGDQYKGYSFFAPSALARITLGSPIALLATNDWSMKFKVIMGEDSSNGYGILRNTAVSNNGSMFLPPTRNKLAFTNDSGSFINVNLTTAIGKGQPAEIEVINEAGSGVTVKIDGVTSSSQTNIGDITFNSFANGRGRAGERVIFDVEVDLTGDATVDHKYAGDGITNSNWADQAGSNNGTILNSTYITAYNNEFTDGFVETWYDQSGNSNDAVQATSGSQPKIVNAGSLVKDSNGHPELNFDGSDSSLLKTAFTQGDLAQANTIFSVAKLDVAADTNRKIYDGTSSFKRNMLFLSTNGSGQFGFFADDVISTGVTATNDKNLFSALFNGASSELFINGASGASGDVGDYPMSGIIIGENHSGGANNWLGQIQELIIYNSDQSANRPAIEANIKNQYEIS